MTTLPTPTFRALLLAAALASPANATARLPTDLGDRAIQDLEQLDARVLTDRDELVVQEEAAPPPPGTRPALERDPVAWGRVLERLPHVARFRTWLAWGGDATSLPLETRSGLEEADRHFEARGLPRPFHPWAYPPDLTGSAEVPDRPVAGLPLQFQGWAAAAIRSFTSAHRLGPELAREIMAGGPYEPDDPRLKLTADLRGRTGALHLAIEHWYHDTTVRLLVDRLTRRGQDHFRAGIHALAQAIRAAPEPERDAIAVLAHRLTGDAKAMAFGAPSHQDQAPLLGRLPDDPAADFLVARLIHRSREARTGLGETPTELLELELAHLDKAQRQPDRGPWARLRAAHALSDALDVLRDADRCEQVARLYGGRRPPPGSVPSGLTENLVRPTFRCVADRADAMGLDRVHLLELFETTRDLGKDADEVRPAKLEERLVRLQEVLDRTP